MSEIEAAKLPVMFQQPRSFEVTILDSKIEPEGTLIRHVAVPQPHICFPRNKPNPELRSLSH